MNCRRPPRRMMFLSPHRLHERPLVTLQVIQRVEPAFPALAKQARIYGTVRLFSRRCVGRVGA